MAFLSLCFFFPPRCKAQVRRRSFAARARAPSLFRCNEKRPPPRVPLSSLGDPTNLARSRRVRGDIPRKMSRPREMMTTVTARAASAAHGGSCRTLARARASAVQSWSAATAAIRAHYCRSRSHNKEDLSHTHSHSSRPCSPAASVSQDAAFTTLSSFFATRPDSTRTRARQTARARHAALVNKTSTRDDLPPPRRNPRAPRLGGPGGGGAHDAPRPRRAVSPSAAFAGSAERG